MPQGTLSVSSIRPELLTQLQRETFIINLNNGWHGKPGSTPSPVATIRALVHSEISEALEAHRIERMKLYFHCTNEEDCGEDTDAPIYGMDFADPDSNKLGPAKCPHCGHNVKPEGFGVELADAAIRVLDRAEKMNYDLTPLMGTVFVQHPAYETPAEYMDWLHEVIVLSSRGGESAWYWANVFRCIEFVCQVHQIDLENLMRLKLAYNKTRGFRHGGKVV